MKPNVVIVVALDLEGGETSLRIVGQQRNARQQGSSFMNHPLQPTESDFEIANAASPVRVYLLPQTCKLHRHALDNGNQQGNVNYKFKGR
ncbi:hypothetical protein H6F76_04700 [Leptolyngbya sp. FACHB-321]|uniref:hypothetical protein n=1 Tax=Leptolyngbya sp. FACHB-321 TaxID=2692807 RepID=UPI001683D5BC|nr:hypothetical protein [Leptolyngbya sp. FACHB-321]MBD2034333.1 hypothetical protein [Leptolyngbya sp. FACHB-321]